MMSQNPNLKEKVFDHILPYLNDSELNDHSTHTDETLDSQKEFLRRLVVERADDPLREADSLTVIGNLDEKSICPFIKGHIVRDI